MAAVVFVAVLTPLSLAADSVPVAASPVVAAGGGAGGGRRLAPFPFPFPFPFLPRLPLGLALAIGGAERLPLAPLPPTARILGNTTPADTAFACVGVAGSGPPGLPTLG